MIKINKVVRVSLSGGLIGLLTTNPRRALDLTIDKHNQEGWNAVYFSNHTDTNLFVTFLRFFVLFFTAGLWTWGAGYLVLFERQRA